MFFASNLNFSVFVFSLNQSKQKENPLANVFFYIKISSNNLRPEKLGVKFHEGGP